MKLKALSSSIIIALLPATGAFAAALDRSGQSISAFLQPNNYFEAGISVLDPDVSGTSIATAPKVSDMADDYTMVNAALKLQLTDHFSFGLIYDQPFGAKATYKTNDGDLLSGTEVDVQSQNLSLIFGFQPTENWNIYGGGVYQTVKGSLLLRGNPLPTADLAPFYDARYKEDGSAGWLAGIAFQIPDIALKASLTYRSEIDHELATQDVIGGGTTLTPSLDTVITTPQSVNLDFQTGIMANTVAFANVRWVNWKELDISPARFIGATNAPLLQYSDDQWSANVGVGRKLNDQWAGNVSVGWDSGAGNPVTALGPTEGYWNVGLGVQFSPAPNYFIAGGVKYFWLGDAKGQLATQAGTPAYVAEFKDNNAIAYGLKIGYKF
ncbi:OmpP1/FadL family transporter [Acinetobacter shaoyimingii]|uniref:Transporter n=1 Tax=Acinetobacter shaoyimingii TaxID=2715164 RepID=A0A6G8RXF1_9GAMM|nr:outer membrane protein transport protein [Acinetobacter shaoyimingii]NHB57681.1 transporter [Acinetobacter shaoyimingii]QIO06622.1 transporter [Acinetobacter shaoyimingii]